MKVFLILNESSAEPAFCFLSDSAVTNTGKPFYIPENKGEIRVCLSAAVKIERLGKGIKKKFARRYFTQMAPALHFHLPQYALQLRAKGLPDDAARNFDKSLFVGDFSHFNNAAEFQLKVNDSTVAAFNLGNIPHPIENVIEEISLMNTLKMGDLILPGLSPGFLVKENDIIEVDLNGEKAFQVRVK